MWYCNQPRERSLILLQILLECHIIFYLAIHYHNYVLYWHDFCWLYLVQQYTFWCIFLLLLQDGSLLAATINGFPLSTAKITEKRKIIEEIALADVKKVRHYFSHHRSSLTRPIYLLYSSLNLSLRYFCLLHSVCFYKQHWEVLYTGYGISTFTKRNLLKKLC